MKLRYPIIIIVLLLATTTISSIGVPTNFTSSHEVRSNFQQKFTVEPSINSYSNGETVGIIVENGLWGVAAIQTAVNQYEHDLNLTGYKTLLDTSISSAATATVIRTLLQTWYTTYQISGVVLIGNLPYALYYHPAAGSFAAETFICELYLTDLDGTWVDNNPVDGTFDGHSAGTGDIFPEIYLGRIDASHRTLGGQTNANNILSIINRLHTYRTGGVARTHQAITYIDDDWQSWADGTFDNWPAWLNAPYPTRTDVHTPTTATTGPDWITRMTQDYEFAHLCAHSGALPSQHYFGPGGVGEGIVTAANIHSTQPTFNFYNLFCCHGADWTQLDCLSTTYLFSSSYSLAVVGSTKTGGMLEGDYFYNPLNQNKTIGEGIYDWFQGITSASYNLSTSGSASWGYYLEWFYGMCILGDPFLTINYDCTVFAPDTITSITHPDDSVWSTNQLPKFNWSVPVDVNGITGFYYILDQNPNTIPTKSTGTYLNAIQYNVPSSLSDGTYYFHIVTEDGAGNIGKTAAHYQVNIDTQNPTISIDSPADSSDVPAGDITLNWTAADTGSGIDEFEIRVDGTLETTLDGSAVSYTLTLTELGTYDINITVNDYAGFSNSEEITIEVIEATTSTTPTNGFSIEFWSVISLGTLTLAFSTFVIKRRLKRKKGT